MDTEENKSVQYRVLSDEDRKNSEYYIYLLTYETHYTKEDFKQCFDLVQSQYTKDVLKAVVMAKQILSTKESPSPFQEFINHGLIPKFILLLKNSKLNHFIYYYCIWTFANICSSRKEHVEECVKEGIIEVSLPFLSHPEKKIQGEVVWLFGNIMAESTNYRDYIISLNYINKILDVTKEQIQNKEKLPDHYVWSIGNLCWGKPKPQYSIITPLISIFAHILETDFGNIENRQYALLALSSLSEGNDSNLYTMFESNAFELIVQCLESKIENIFKAALNTIGNLVKGDLFFQTLAVLDTPKCLESLIKILYSLQEPYRKKSLWVISTIVRQQVFINRVLENEKTFKRVVDIAVNDFNSVQKEAFYLFYYIAHSGNLEYIQKLINYDIIRIFKNGLLSEHTDSILACLLGIQSLINLGSIQFKGEERIIRFRELIETSCCIDVIERLKNHEDLEISQRSNQIFEQIYNLDENEQ